MDQSHRRDRASLSSGADFPYLNYYYSRVNLSPILFHSDNSTNVFQSVMKYENTSTQEDSWSYCNEWIPAQHNLYQTANVIMSVAFLVPTTYKQSLLLIRALLTVSYIILTCNSSKDLCAPDMLTWNILLGVINMVYTCSLIWKFLPPTFSLELTELYVKVFQPLRVSKKHFKDLVKETHLVTLDKGDIYAVEDASPADERLSILISGKLKVTCNDTHLHFISAHQFIDSPEWEANHEQSDDLFQVTITAEEDAIYLCWSRMRLERVLRHRPVLKMVLDSIIGKDITQKLYSLNENLCGLDIERTRIKQNEAHEIWAKATRSMSVDAIYTESTGRVQSTAVAATTKPRKYGINHSTSCVLVQNIRLTQQYWVPIVANHFPVEFPFAGIQAYNAKVASYNAALLHTPPSMNQEPTTVTSSIFPQIHTMPMHATTPMKRTISFTRRSHREVKFEEAMIT